MVFERWRNRCLPALRSLPERLPFPLALFLVRPAVDQSPQEGVEVQGQHLGIARLGVDVGDPRFAPRPASTVVEEDPVVPGGRGPADDDPNLRIAGLAD